MKTSINHNRASRMASVLCAAIALGTSVWAQSDAGSDNSNTAEAYDRLEVLMASTKEAVKYTAPPAGDSEAKEAMDRLELLANNTERVIRYEASFTAPDELDKAVERLEMLASHIEKEIRYTVTDNEPAMEVEYAAADSNPANGISNALTLPTAYLSNRIRK